MQKSTKIILGVGGSLLALSLGYAVYRKLRNKPEDSEETIFDAAKEVIQETIGLQNPTACSDNARFPLKVGSKGREVKDLQLFLNKFQGSKLTTDCIFGKQTEAQLVNFYRQNNMTVKTELSEGEYNDIVKISLQKNRLIISKFWDASWF